MIHKRLLFLAALLLAFLPGVHAQIVAEDLGTLAGNSSFGADINNQGQIAGSGTYDASFLRHPLRWNPDGTGFEDLFSGAAGHANGRIINDLGQVVSVEGIMVYFCPETCVQFSDQIPLNPLSFRFIFPNKMNNAGHILGAGITNSNAIHGFIWTPVYDPVTGKVDPEASVSTDMGTLGGTDFRSFAINDQGLAVGRSTTASGATHAFLWTPGEVPGTGTMEDLGTLGGNFSQALDINEIGTVVGISSNADGRGEAFIWTRQDGMQPLPLRGTTSSARAINNQGQVLGFHNNVDGVGGNLFLWSRDAGFEDIITDGISPLNGLDLNDLGQVFIFGFTASGPKYFVWERTAGLKELLPFEGGSTVTAAAMNDLGQVVGNSVTAAGVTHLALWNVPPPAPATPDAQIGQLAGSVAALVDSGALNQGPAAALASKLDAALLVISGAAGGTTTPDLVAAVNMLNAFINQANAFVKSGKLSDAEGQALVDAAGGIIASL